MQLSTSRSDSGWQQRIQRMQQQLAAADMARQHAQAEADQLRFQSGEATQKVSRCCCDSGLQTAEASLAA